MGSYCELCCSQFKIDKMDSNEIVGFNEVGFVSVVDNSLVPSQIQSGELFTIIVDGNKLDVSENFQLRDNLTIGLVMSVDVISEDRVGLDLVIHGYPGQIFNTDTLVGVGHPIYVGFGGKGDRLDTGGHWPAVV